MSYRGICIFGLLLAMAAGYIYELSFTCDFYVFATPTVTSNIMMCFLQSCKVRHIIWSNFVLHNPKYI
jgi:hypothetical protein